MKVQIFLTAILIASLLTQTHSYTQTVNRAPDVQTYSPSEAWPEPKFPPPWVPSAFSDTMPFNDVYVSGSLPIRGYPMHSTTIKGLNDTLQIILGMRNRSGTNYSLVGKVPEKWFAPRIFRNDDNVYTAIPLKDSTELGYRMRGWQTSRQKPMIARDTIPGKFDGAWSWVIDVWKLAEGYNTIVIAPTGNSPNDFYIRTDGDNYEFLHAIDIADTINAYEGCFWRAIRDTNYTAAKQWVNKILDVNPNSVPGWWLRAYTYRYLNDTTEVKLSLDKAIDRLYEGDDPAMPDSTKRGLFPVEKHYLEYCKSQLKHERSQFAP